MTTERCGHTTILLPSGKVLIAGGANGSAVRLSSELFDPGLGFDETWRPAVTTIGFSPAQPTKLTITGTGFTGLSEASGGSFNNSATNYPLLQLQRIDNEQFTFIRPDPAAFWSATAFNSIPLTSLPGGAYRATIFANGIPSQSKMIVVDPLLSGLVAWYPFNGNATDAGPNGNNLTVNGATLAADQSGNANSAYSFDGVNDYLLASPATGLVGGAEATYAAWVYPSSLPSDNKYLAIAGTGDASLSTHSPRQCSLLLTKAAGELPRFATYCSVNNEISSYVRRESASTYPLNAWYHVTAVFNNGTINVYVNGVLDNGTGTVMAGSQLNTNPTKQIWVGALTGAGATYAAPFKGTIDDVRVYSRALSAGEIQALYSLAAVDTTPPDTTITAQPVTPTTSTTADFSFTSNETGTTFECKLDTGAFATCTSPKTYTGLTEGSHTFQVQAKDPAGNVDASPASYTWIIDITAPTLTVTAPVNGLATASAALTVTGTATDAGSGLKSVTVNGTAVTVVSGGAFTQNVTLVSGANTITVIATDNVNLTTTVSRTVTYNPPDVTIPTLTVTAPVNGLITNVATLAVTGTATDAGSGLKTVTINGTAVTVGVGGAFSGNVTLVAGTTTITVIATDNANNSATVTRTVTLDQVAPTLTVTNPANNSCANIATITVTGTATDAGSGLKTLTVNGTAVTVGAGGAFSATVTLTAGANTITVVATDNAANQTTVTRAITFDQTAPVLTVSTLANGSTTNNATLNVSGTVTDPESGIKSLTVNGVAVTPTGGAYSKAVTLTTGANTITVIATNGCGTTTPDSRTITYDSGAPVPTIDSPANNSITKDTPITITGRVNETASVQCWVNDGAKQYATVTGLNFTCPVNLSLGQNTVNVLATDLGNNTGSAAITVTHDLIAPNLAITDPPQDITTTQSSYPIQGTVSDPLSGIASLTLTMDGQTFNPVITNGSFSQQVTFTTEKQYAVEVTATDQAGNSATVQRNIIYAKAPIGATLDLGSVSGVKGKNISIPVTLTNVAGIGLAAVGSTITYDTAVLDTPTVTTGPAATAAGKTAQLGVDPLDASSLLLLVASFTNDPIANGVVAYLNFGIKTTAALGVSTLQNRPSGADTLANDVLLAGANGVVTVVAKPGDCNGDGSVSVAEVQSAINMYLRTKPVAACVDLDGSGATSVAEVQKVINAYLKLL